ncbi:LysR substrate-binding domain-containing protein [Brucella gallinifaecis]|uniref:LysR family transcriptional regulator n=1 Tax=Brucella gallinifaecis TaxID=215590 RepID=A0A502BN24_9HYPH|nr:LysR substrate-binding domain-containing protein [Brucella gallinifaecis]TPF74668.1 LysR family transcriptional regulator [Brucella gallinifaecis]
MNTKLDNIRVNISNRLDLLTLRLFVAMAEEKTIVKAAERENIASSAVSKRLADLEQALHTQLFFRLRSGLEPTEAGKVLLRHCNKLLRNISDLELELQDHTRGLNGHVRILANESALFNYLPEKLAAFGRKYPGVRVDLQAAMSPDILGAMIDKVADIGFLSGDPPIGDFNIIRSADDEIVVIIPSGHPLDGFEQVNLQMIAEFAIVHQEARSSIQIALAAAALQHGVPLKSNFRAGGFDAVCRMVEAGLGIGFIPRAVASRMQKAINFSVSTLNEPWAVRQNWICSGHNGELSAAAQRLIAEIVE